MKNVCLFASVAVVAIALGCSRESSPTSPTRAAQELLAGTAVSVSAMPGMFGATVVDFARCLQGAADAACLSAARFSAHAVSGGAATAPGAPGNLSTSSSGSTVTLTWTAPGSGDATTGYVIEAGSAPGLANLAVVVTGSTATSFSATGIGSGTYYVRVRAQNASGTSGASNESTLVVGSSACTSAPGAPGGLAITSSGSTVTLAWNAPSGGCAPTSYVLQAGSSPGLSNLANSNVGNTTSYVATGVGNGTYYVRVRAANAYGQSAGSNEFTLAVGSAPTALFTRSGTGNTTFNIPATVATLRITGSYTLPFPSCQNFIVYISYHVLVNEVLGAPGCYQSVGPTIDRTKTTYGANDVTITGSSGVVWTLTEVR
jgi:predicted phage tail protein